MKRLAIFKDLRYHRKLAEKRAVTYKMNKFAKGLTYVGGSIVLLYLLMFAVMFALIANELKSKTSLEMICSFLPFIMVVDFGVRFMAQQTPSQLIKPYVLLPLPRYVCIESFLGTTLLSWGNVIWGAMLIPYCLMSVVFSFGIIPTILLLLFYYVMILINSQWYIIVRTLITDTMLWWFLPIVMYVIAAMPCYIGGKLDVKQMLDFYGVIGRWFEHGNPLPILFAMIGLAGLLIINRKMQYNHVWEELGKITRVRKMKSVSEFRFLNRYGEVGEYLKLEIKSIMRNKNPKKAFIMSFMLTAVFSTIITYTKVYDDEFSNKFFCIYNFMIFGISFNMRIMGNEGNYIDGLMVNRENILSLLKAKYIFTSIILLVPFAIMLPAAFAGKFHILMLLGYGLLTMGLGYFMMFQMAVFNKTTIPLNSKFISKNVENNYVQIIVEMVALFLPVVLIFLLQAFMSKIMSYWVMIIIGMTFILTSNIWLRNIYKRMMKHRYTNLEGFRASR